MAAPPTAVSAYRALLRAQRQLFLGDAHGRTAALIETRTRFYEQSHASPEEVPKLVEDAHEAALFLRQNIAQAVLNDRGNYGIATSLRYAWHAPYCLELYF
jgi:complex III assembly factor LYRM7